MRNENPPSFNNTSYGVVGSGYIQNKNI